MFFYNIEKCLKMLFLVGVHPEIKNSKWQFLLFFITAFGGLSVIYMVVLLLVYKEETLTIMDFTDTFSACSMLLHGLLRLTSLFKNRSKVLDLLQRMNKYFWSVDDIEDKTEQNRYKKSLGRVKKIFHLFAMMCISTATTFSLGTFITEDDNLAFECYRPKWIGFYPLQLYQTIVNIFSVNIPIVGMDVLLMTFISLTAVQFEMLNETIRTVFDNANNVQKERVYVKEKVKNVIDHHNFLLDYISRINDTFSTFLLGYMAIIVSSMCVEMYNLSSKGTLEVFMKAAIYISAALFQFVICYCLPGQGLIDEANKIRDSIYLSEWISTNGYSNEVIMMMANGQANIGITAGGILQIDLATSLSTVKTMVSYCMFLRTVGSEEEY